MEMKEFLSILKEAKQSSLLTSKISLNINVYVQSKNVLLLIRNTKCSSCKHIAQEKLKVHFIKEWRLSVFEAALVFMLFFDKKIPKDYAKYHKCIAGERFIANIKKVERC